jgi:hypothetical protein
MAKTPTNYDQDKRENDILDAARRQKDAQRLPGASLTLLHLPPNKLRNPTCPVCAIYSRDERQRIENDLVVPNGNDTLHQIGDRYNLSLSALRSHLSSCMLDPEALMRLDSRSTAQAERLAHKTLGWFTRAMDAAEDAIEKIEDQAGGPTVGTVQLRQAQAVIAARFLGEAIARTDRRAIEERIARIEAQTQAKQIIDTNNQPAQAAKPTRSIAALLALTPEIDPLS